MPSKLKKPSMQVVQFILAKARVQLMHLGWHSKEESNLKDQNLPKLSSYVRFVIIVMLSFLERGLTRDV